jgi:hypothetical protein
MADYQEIVRASNTDYSADETQWPSADGGLLANLVEVIEPVSSVVTADTTAYSADNTNWPTADGGELTGATDYTDAEVIPATAVGGGGYYPPARQRPHPIEGYGYGALPPLEGDAIGFVAAVGAGRGQFPQLRGGATGTVGVAGRSVGRLVLRATASGVRGQTGVADAVVKRLSGTSSGAVAVRGAGRGIVRFTATAVGRQGDDEAAMIAFLLAA